MSPDTLPTQRRSWVEVDLSALRHNVRTLRKHLKKSGTPAFIAIIKANAYGHGAARIATELAPHVDAFGVATVQEALEISSCKKDVLLLGPTVEENLQEAFAAGIIFTISNRSELQHLIAQHSATPSPPPLRVHLKVDTGMGRVGSHPGDFSDLLSAAAQEKVLSVFSMGTHLPSADCDPEFTHRQLQNFTEMIAPVRKAFPGVLVHALNSAGVLNFPEFAFDAVRVGLAFYGIAPTDTPLPLRPALTWKTRLSLVREVPANTPVSYGSRFITKRATRLGLLPLGYADGYFRCSSGKNAVLLQGRRCSQIGTITMDQMMIDLSDLPADQEIKPQDEVVLLGSQGSEQISMHELAEHANSIPWEIFTSIGSRVDRVYY
ncbi:MAG: alanine racemase [Chthoniobacterales bacterium]